jgi:hypothetical protein
MDLLIIRPAAGIVSINVTSLLLSSSQTVLLVGTTLINSIAYTSYVGRYCSATGWTVRGSNPSGNKFSASV